MPFVFEKFCLVSHKSIRNATTTELEMHLQLMFGSHLLWLTTSQANVPVLANY